MYKSTRSCRISGLRISIWKNPLCSFFPQKLNFPLASLGWGGVADREEWHGLGQYSNNTVPDSAAVHVPCFHAVNYLSKRLLDPVHILHFIWSSTSYPSVEFNILTNVHLSEKQPVSNPLRLVLFSLQLRALITSPSKSRQYFPPLRVPTHWHWGISQCLFW